MVRILRGKLERTQNHQWLQTSRTRATEVVKTLCSVNMACGRRDVTLDFASSLGVFFLEDRAQNLLDRFPVEAAVHDLRVRVSVQGAYKKCQQKIAVRDLKTIFS